MRLSIVRPPAQWNAISPEADGIGLSRRLGGMDHDGPQHNTRRHLSLGLYDVCKKSVWTGSDEQLNPSRDPLKSAKKPSKAGEAFKELSAPH